MHYNKIKNNKKFIFFVLICIFLGLEQMILVPTGLTKQKKINKPLWQSIENSFLKNSLGIEFFYDVNSITHLSKNNIKVWTKYVYPTKVEKSGSITAVTWSPCDEFFELIEFDCIYRMERTRSISCSKEGKIFELIDNGRVVDINALIAVTRGDQALMLRWLNNDWNYILFPEGETATLFGKLCKKDYNWKFLDSNKSNSQLFYDVNSKVKIAKKVFRVLTNLKEREREIISIQEIDCESRNTFTIDALSLMYIGDRLVATEKVEPGTRVYSEFFEEALIEEVCKPFKNIKSTYKPWRP